MTVLPFTLLGSRPDGRTLHLQVRHEDSGQTIDRTLPAGAHLSALDARPLYLWQDEPHAWEAELASDTLPCHPLPASGVRSVAKSVARWTWRHAHTLSVSPLGGQRRNALKSRDRPLMLQAEAKARQSAAGEYTSRLVCSRTLDGLTAAASGRQQADQNTAGLASRCQHRHGQAVVEE